MQFSSAKTTMFSRSLRQTAAPIQSLTRDYSASTGSEASQYGGIEDCSLNNNSYQYLHKSPVPTDKFAASLPRLPIPKLEKTFERYLNSQKAYLPEDDFKRTEDIVQRFKEGEANALDSELRAIDKANKHTSYISKPWTEMYLKDNRSVVFNHNPGIRLANDTRPDMMQIDVRMASLLISSLRFHKSYRESILKPDVFHMKPAKTDNDTYWNRVRFFPSMIATPLSYLFKVFPLDMSQHPNLFQSTRIPGEDKDFIQKFPDSKHILIMRNGHFYTFPVYDEQWNIFEPSYYLDSIRTILEDKAPPAPGIGILTSMDRREWCQVRKHLLSLGNDKELNQIDSAMFNICLDDDYVHDEDNTQLTVRNLVSGLNPINRWFDKSFSLICSRNGVVGINFEHAWGDGVAVVRYLEDALGDSQKSNRVLNSIGGKSKTTVNVTRLTLKTDEAMNNQIKKATEAFKAKCDSVKYDLFMMGGVGKNDCKNNNVGPDSFMQAGFQVAYHKMTGNFAATYESCSTAIYRNGRTETIRPCTNETSTLARALNQNGSLKPDDFLNLLRNCSKKHFELTKSCAQGQGWDRHLFCLKQLALEKDGKLPEIFQDESYQKINQIIMSTSTLSTAAIIGGAFCPVTPKGFGMGYMITNEGLGVNLSSYSNHTNGQEFIQALKDTFKQFRDHLHTAGKNA